MSVYGRLTDAAPVQWLLVVAMVANHTITKFFVSNDQNDDILVFHSEFEVLGYSMMHKTHYH